MLHSVFDLDVNVVKHIIEGTVSWRMTLWLNSMSRSYSRAEPSPNAKTV